MRDCEAQPMVWLQEKGSSKRKQPEIAASQKHSAQQKHKNSISKYFGYRIIIPG